MDPLRASNKLRRLIRAYHGSPHNFSRFDASKIGTGEGAQAYGHGLYFAGNEGVARSYRDIAPSALPPERLAAVEAAKAQWQEALDKWTNAEKAIADLHAARGTRAPGWGDIATVPHGDPELVRLTEEYNRWQQAMDSATDAQNAAQFGRQRGHMYEVEIGYPEEALLDWDKPVGAELAGRLDSRMAGDLAAEAQRMADMGQLPRHTQTLNRIASGEFGLAPGEMVYRAAGRFDTPATKLDLASIPSVPRGWGSVTNTINDSLTNQAKASDRLMESGIPGIRYLDQGSRSAGEGTRNYVMFPGTEDRIRILRKYGLLAPLGAGAMGGEE